MFPLKNLCVLPDGRRHIAGLLSECVFGPVDSRRFGRSLGVNLFPAGEKVCSFNCLYCECGGTRHLIEEKDVSLAWPSKEAVISEMETILKECLSGSPGLDSITFAGNGEPTLHPDFGNILVGILDLRDKYVPSVQVIVLTNGSMLEDAKVAATLPLADQVCFKLDATNEEEWHALNRPHMGISFSKLIDRLSEYPDPVIQTMVVQGKIDNVSEANLDEWAQILNRVRPSQWDIYSLDRIPATSGLEKVEKENLTRLGESIQDRLFCPVHVY